MSAQTEPRIPLPKGWIKHVRLSLLHVTDPQKMRGGGLEEPVSRLDQPVLGSRIDRIIEMPN